MAALVEGRNYGLSSLLSTSGSQKTAIHVKLTDSALRAIEEFQNRKQGTNKRPKIQFQGQQGIIQVPSRNEGSDLDWNSFSFSLSSIQGDPNGSFECIQQSSRGDLDVVGCLSQKMTVHATDDVYNTTRVRMKHAEEENKKYCAVEIKPGGKNIGRRVKRVLKHSEVSAPPNSVPSAKRISIKPAHPNPATSRPPPPPQPQEAREARSNVVHPASHHQPTAKVQMNTSSSSASPHQTQKPQHTHPELMKKPLRERIMHLLAIRPYKKPEVMYKLQKEGIKDKDRHQIGTVLSQVGHFNIKDNSYTLQRNLYAEVKSSWPTYRDEDRELLKQHLASVERGVGGSTFSPAISPVHSNSSNSSPPQKRPCEDVIEPASKKMRVAHQPASDRNNMAAAIAAVTAKHEPDTSLSLSFSKDTSPLVSQENQLPAFSKDDQIMKSKIEEDGNGTDSGFKSMYGLIENAEQRSRYKIDFNQDYNEYRQLHCSLQEKTQIFHDLKEKLRLEQKRGMEENIENIKNKILTEYKQLRRDQRYLEQRKRCDFLHKKLAHIKQLIASYDMSSSQVVR